MLYQFFIEANGDDSNGTSKGLLALFALGFIPLFLGVSISEINLYVPWLDGIKIEKHERLSLVYSSIVLFSVFRFYKRNKATFIFILSDCFRNFLFSDRGMSYAAGLVNLDFKCIRRLGRRESVIKGKNGIDIPCYIISIGFDDLNFNTVIYFEIIGFEIFYRCFEIPNTVPRNLITAENCRDNFFNVELENGCRIFEKDNSLLNKRDCFLIVARNVFKVCLSELRVFDVIIPIWLNLIFVNFIVWKNVITII